MVNTYMCATDRHVRIRFANKIIKLDYVWVTYISLALACY